MAKVGRPKGAEKIREEMEEFPVCEAYPDCHAWQEGRCICLRDNCFGERECPFYKKRSKNRREQQECLKRLVKKGRADLVEKYRKVLGRIGVFEISDGYMEAASAELERYEGECLKELLAGTCAVEVWENEWDD